MTQHNHKAFSYGARISYRGRNATLFPLEGTNKISVNFDDGTSKQMTRAVLMNALVNHELQLIGNSDDGEAILAAIADESKQEQTARRAAYVHDLRRKKSNRSLSVIEESIEETAERIHDQKPPSPITVYKWLVKADSKGKTKNPLVGLAPKPRNRDKRVPQPVEDMLQLVMERVVLRRKKKTLMHGFRVFQRLCKLFLGIEIKASRKSTFYNRYHEIDPYQRVEKRDGKQAAKALARHGRAEVRVGSILEQFQFDAVTLAIGLLDGEDNYIGFPVIHLAIDVYSLAIVGFAIELNSESSSGVLECMKNTFRIKLKDIDHPFTKNEWIMFGSCLTVVTDGGAGYMSQQVGGYLSIIGISRTACKTRTPWHKANVERVNRTIRDRFADHFGGYIGRRDDPKGCETELRKAACRTIDEFTKEFTQYIVDDYNQCPNSTFFGRSPHNVWLDETIKNDPPVEPDYLEIAELLRGDWYEPTYDHTNGLRINNVWYNDENSVLHEIFLKERKKKEAFKFHCLYNHSDISEITIKHGENLIVAKWRKAEGRIHITKGMSLDEYNAKRARRKQDAEEENANSDAHYDYATARELHDMQQEAGGAPNPDIPVRQRHRRAAADLETQALYQEAAEIAVNNGFLGSTEPSNRTPTSEQTEDPYGDDNPYADLVQRHKNNSEDVN